MTKIQPKFQGEFPAPKGKLVLIGGKENLGKDPIEGSNQEGNRNFEYFSILKRFINELRGKDPLLVIIPTATNTPGESSDGYRNIFHHLGLKNIAVADIKDRQEAHDEKNLELGKNADGIFFTGGDQLRLTSILGGTDFLNIVKERYIKEKIVVAGTSAGATAMSTPMIYEGKSVGGFLKGDVHVATGLEFLKDFAIDTHFIARGRLSRMAQVIATNPSCLCIGLEEDTAIIVTDGSQVEVIGSGMVTILDGQGNTSSNIYEVENGKPVTIRNYLLHMLAKGDNYTIIKTGKTIENKIEAVEKVS